MSTKQKMPKELIKAWAKERKILWTYMYIFPMACIMLGWIISVQVMSTQQIITSLFYVILVIGILYGLFSGLMVNSKKSDTEQNQAYRYVRAVRDINELHKEL